MAVEILTPYQVIEKLLNALEAAELYMLGTHGIPDNLSTFIVETRTEAEKYVDYCNGGPY